MKTHRKLVSLAFALAVSNAVGLGQGADSPSKAKPKSNPQKAAPSIQKQLQQMRDELQGEINDLRQKLAIKDAEVAALQAAARTSREQSAALAAHVDTIDSTVQQTVSVDAGLNSSIADLKLNSVEFKSKVAAVQTAQQSLEKAVNEPISIHFKSVTLTPGGFIAGESVWRQRALNADIYTDFNLTPYMNSVRRTPANGFLQPARRDQIF